MKKYFAFFAACSVFSLFGATVKISNLSNESIFVQINDKERFWAPIEREMKLPWFVPDIWGALDNHIADFRQIRPREAADFNTGLRSIHKITFMRISQTRSPYVVSQQEGKNKILDMLKKYSIEPTLANGKVPGYPFHSEYFEKGRFYQQKLLEKLEKYKTNQYIYKLL